MTGSRTSYGNNMNNEYNLTDGSPRYGARSDDHSSPPVPGDTLRVEETPEAAARLGLDHLAAAIDRRLTSLWADRENPLVVQLRKAYPEELAAARALVTMHLGSQRQWRIKAQAVRDKHLAETMRRRRASGSALEIMLLRLGLIIALIAPPVYVVATSRDDILKLVLTGAVCMAAAYLGGHFITIRSRIPVTPNIRGAWLRELREDVVNATLVAVLQNKGVAIEPATAAAGRRGWDSIASAAKAVEALQG
jgi:hypothetical protein